MAKAICICMLAVKYYNLTRIFLSASEYYSDAIQIYHSSTGMAGKDSLSNAMLGGVSDYLADVSLQLSKAFFAPAEEKVRVLFEHAVFCEINMF